MKKLTFLAFVMILITVCSALAIDVVPDNEFEEISTSRTNIFFGTLQQTVIPSSTNAKFGEVVTFTFTTTAEETTNNAIYVFELHKDGSLYQRKSGLGSLVVQSNSAFSVNEGQSFQTKIAQYFSQSFYDEGVYQMVAYLYDNNRHQIISQRNDYATFRLGTGLTDAQCRSQFEGTCNQEIGLRYNCRVAPTGLSCQCDVDNCALKEVCSAGQCIPSNECEPDLFEFATVCDERATDECGGTHSRNTDGISCGANAKCVNGECIKSCSSGYVGDKYCSGNDVKQTYKKSDCSTEERTIKTCSQSQICTSGDCVNQDIEEGVQEEETTQQEETTSETASQTTSTTTTTATTTSSQESSTTASSDLCVVDAECGYGYECVSGECKEPGVDYSFAIVMIVVVVIIIGLFAVNYFTSRKNKKKRK